jgi:polar amino acid transport system substrate-binding protein
LVVSLVLVLVAIPLMAAAQTVAMPGSTRPPFSVSLSKYSGEFATAAWMTIKLSLLAMTLATSLGLTLALMRLYGGRFARGFAILYVEFVRGTPLLVQLYFIYYGLPQLSMALIAMLKEGGVDTNYPGLYSALAAALGWLKLNPFTAAVIGVGLNYAAYEAEVYRTGLMAVPRTQNEAAAALGLTKWQAIRLVTLPQALRLVIPPVTNDFVALFKDTSIVSVISVVELTYQSKIASTSTQYYMEYAVVTALIYFAITYPISRAARAMERRIHPHHDTH